MPGQDAAHPNSDVPDSDTLMDYALGFLSPQEALLVESALEGDPQARRELQHYLDGLSALVLDQPTQPLPAGAEDRLMARLNAELAAQPSGVGVPVQGESAASVSPAPVPLAASPRRTLLYPLLGAAAAILLLVAVLPALRGTAPDQLAQYRGQPGAVASVIPAPDGKPLAEVVRLKDGSAYVQLSATAALPGGKVYQAWKIVGKQPVSLGVFSGRGFVAHVPAGTVFAVTLEPEGGSPQPTSTPLFAHAI